MSHGCAEWRGDLAAYVIGALEEDECAAMRRHLAGCPACRADYVDFLPVRDWLTQARRHLAVCRECRADYETPPAGATRYRTAGCGWRNPCHML
jgi:hypothetical protein